MPISIIKNFSRGEQVFKDAVDSAKLNGIWRLIFLLKSGYSYLNAQILQAKAEHPGLKVFISYPFV